MPDLFLRIQVGDAVEVVKAIEMRLEDPSEFMTDCLLVMIRSTQLTFEAEGRPTRWTPLALSTVHARLRRNASGRTTLREGLAASRSGGSRAAGVKAQDRYFAAVGSVKMLRDTGALFLSVGGSATGAFDTEGGFGESDKFTATLGTNRVQAEAIQFVIAGGRPFLVIQNQDEEDVMDMSLEWVMGTGAYA